MGRKPKVLPEIKIAVVEAYLKAQKSVIQISNKLSVSTSTVEAWIRIFRSKGSLGLLPTIKNTSYSKEIKVKAIEEYLSGSGSLWDITMKYGLRSKRQLETWIMKYNGHEEIRASGLGGNQVMIKGRVTTLEERIAIVEHCIKNDKNYNETARKYQVSYQQVRSWVMKFEESGIDGLLDRRGKRRSKDQMTEVEKLKAEMKLLAAKNKRLEMENEVLKKLEEIGRRRG